MGRLIDVDEAKAKIIAFATECSSTILPIDAILMILNQIDTVEVLRCRDCKYWGDEDGILQDSDGEMFARCKAHNHLVDGRHTGWCPSENDFCSYGERKEGSGNG